MKTKLLKIVRRKFSIYEYPNRKQKFVIECKLDNSDNWALSMDSIFTGKREKYNFHTLQEAKDQVLSMVKAIYFEHSKRYKLGQIKRKAWHEN